MSNLAVVSSLGRGGAGVWFALVWGSGFGVRADRVQPTVFAVRVFADRCVGEVWWGGWCWTFGRPLRGAQMRVLRKPICELAENV